MSSTQQIISTVRTKIVSERKNHKKATETPTRGCDWHVVEAKIKARHFVTRFFVDAPYCSGRARAVSRYCCAEITNMCTSYSICECYKMLEASFSTIYHSNVHDA